MRMSEVRKKIGVLTLHKALNYGAVWQCWALKRACELQGYFVETINYNPHGHQSLLDIIKHQPIVAYRYLTRIYQFGRFVSRYLNPSCYTESHEWIKANPPQDDVYIVGSDQVWSNELVGELLDSYLLDWAPKEIRRIAYAASTGGGPLEVNTIQLAELRKFSSISVREKQSVESVQDKVSIPVADVCDPTLLLTQKDYITLEKKPIRLPKHYIAYFDLAGDTFSTQSALMLRDHLSLPIVNMASKYRRWANFNYVSPTPEQWLYIMHHADYICTNSFHGVAFTIIFRRPFVYCAPQIGTRSKVNARVLNLLEQVHMNSTYATDITHVEQVIKSKVNYNDEAIEKYRIRSLRWLKQALEDEANKE